jgi:NADPH-dependent ferric siderophore reductase
MVPDRMLDLVGRPGGPLAEAALWNLEVIETRHVTPNMHRLVLTAPGLGDLRYKAGQDLMLRLQLPGDRMVNRRYTIRSFEQQRPAVTLDVSVHGAGPGTDWVRAAEIGSHIDAIGPRGKITLRDDADWHMFIGDETGLPGALAMTETLPAGFNAIGIFEVDSPADEQLPSNDKQGELDVRWLHRLSNSVPGDVDLLLEALSATRLPTGNGHVYVAAEARVSRMVARALTERGFDVDQISAKAYWRRGLPNAEHGEPTRDD